MRKFIFVSILLLCFAFPGFGQGTLSLGITGYDAKCNGSTTGSAKVHVSGGVAPFSFVWTPAVGSSDTVTGLVAGTYNVTVTDSLGLSVAGSVTITQPAQLTVWIDSIVVPDYCLRTTTGSCGCGNSVWAVVSGGTTPYTYLWTPDGYNTDTVNGACYLEWAVVVTDKNNCVSTDSVDITIPSIGPFHSNLVQQVGDEGARIFPNPAGNQLNLDFGKPLSSSIDLVAYNLFGAMVFEQKLATGQRMFTLDVSMLAAGSYLVGDAGAGLLHNTLLTIER